MGIATWKWELTGIKVPFATWEWELTGIKVPFATWEWETTGIKVPFLQIASSDVNLAHEARIHPTWRVVPSVAPRRVDLRTGLDVLGIVVWFSRVPVRVCKRPRRAVGELPDKRRRADVGIDALCPNHHARMITGVIAVCVDQACKSTLLL